MLGGQDLRGRAVAALNRATLDELLLQGGDARRQAFLQAPFCAVIFFALQPFKGDDRSTVGLGSQQDSAVDNAVATGVVRRAGEENGIGAAFACFVTVFEAEDAQTAQSRTQQLSGVDVDEVVGTVDCE